nr:heparan-alpha-glucosaminide N-acetyltransferase-like isoform X1 [Neodiprion pinetum]XP_046485537.1 heparan-alpha-glucosaminide N-acetyltransferase-like isoform X1 [Neodiprion pinetum]XP_046485538.1 heparan-alpha-glucosaminide N-acetyltransferase-like isoform X1 [Neodiprion pinetum]
MELLVGRNGNFSCDDKTLGIDIACLSLINSNNGSIKFYGQSTECFLCNGTLRSVLPGNSNTTLSVDTKHPYHVYYVQDGLEYCQWVYFAAYYCSFLLLFRIYRITVPVIQQAPVNDQVTTFKFEEHGHYEMNLTDRSCSEIYTTYQPPNPYMPILAAFMLMFFFSATWALGTFVVRSGLMTRFLRRDVPEVQSDLGRLQENESSPRPIERVTRFSTRAKFLDTFRGIAILLMIFVNNGGGKYWFFNHSPWNGITLADLVLPFFAWIMGFTIIISLRTQLRISISRSRIILRCFCRSVTLIFLGLVINSLTRTTENCVILKLNDLRFPGILQLLGVSYFICATLEAIFTKAQRTFQYDRLKFLQDILDAWAQWLVIIAIATTHLLLTFHLPVPGCPKGYLGPGGLHEHGAHANCTAGAAGYIDRTIFGNHIYMKKSGVYGKHPPYDPEGIMSTISAVLLVYMGVQAGRIMLTYHQAKSRVIRWLLWSVITGILAGILCNFSKEDGVIPVNKSMMSLSYVLATSSIAFAMNTILYILIDLQHWWSGAPFFYAGTNAIFLYMGHYFTMGVFPWTLTINGVRTHANVLSLNLWTTALWAIITYVLHKKEIILTV